MAAGYAVECLLVVASTAPVWSNQGDKMQLSNAQKSPSVCAKDAHFYADALRLDDSF